MAPSPRALTDRLFAVRDTASGLWGARTMREQVLVALALVVLSLFVWRFAVWGPIETARAQALVELRAVETYRAQLAVLPADVSPQAQSRAPLRETITSTAASASLAVTRVETTPAGLEVEFDNIEFAALIPWVNDLQRQAGVQVLSAELSRQPSPGFVTARLTFQE